jgi:hypothetical protein
MPRLHHPQHPRSFPAPPKFEPFCASQSRAVGPRVCDSQHRPTTKRCPATRRIARSCNVAAPQSRDTTPYVGPAVDLTVRTRLRHAGPLQCSRVAAAHRAALQDRESVTRSTVQQPNGVRPLAESFDPVTWPHLTKPCDDTLSRCPAVDLTVRTRLRHAGPLQYSRVAAAHRAALLKMRMGAQEPSPARPNAGCH